MDYKTTSPPPNTTHANFPSGRPGGDSLGKNDDSEFSLRSPGRCTEEGKFSLGWVLVCLLAILLHA